MFTLSSTAPEVHSFKDLDPENVMAYGEFAYYVKYIEMNNNENKFDTSNVAGFFDLETSFSNFMNPANLQVFFDKYADKNYDGILKRFSISDYA